MKYLTKTKFKLAMECPTKLYYHEHKEKYANRKIDDPFLNELAKGGFLVGELAKCYYERACEVDALDHEKALKETAEQLKHENVVIFEAAIRYGNLFVRIDILEKKANEFNLIEVKSKSANPETFETDIWNLSKLKKGEYYLKSDWRPYIYDVAFQAYVLKKAYPNFTINNFLLCADKTQAASVEGLNQKFRLREEGGQTTVEVKADVTPETLGNKILCQLPLNDAVEIIHQEKEMSERFGGRGFEEAILEYGQSLKDDRIILSSIASSKCKNCEFRTDEESKLSGFNECWLRVGGLDEEILKRPLVIDVANFRKADDSITNKKFLMEDLDESLFKIDLAKGGAGMSQGQRQLLQVEKSQKQRRYPLR